METTDLKGTGAAQGRYRTLLEVSSAIAAQPNVSAVLKSLSRLLSSVVAFNAISLALLESNARTVRLIAFDKSPGMPDVELGTQVRIEGTTFEKVIEQQKPVFVPDIKGELAAAPEVASRFKGSLYPVYIFPVSAGDKKLGALLIGTGEGKEFSADDLELISSVAAHVAVALESALANDATARYQHELAAERDRLRLLLDINNQVVTILDINDLFRAASASIRKYFANDFTSGSLLDERSNCFNCVVMDFPDGRVATGDLWVTPLSEINKDHLDRLQLRLPTVWAAPEIARMPANVADFFRAESIVTVVSLPLIGARGLIGVMLLGYRKVKTFAQADLDLLSQISNQISLALDNALAYGRVTASRDLLEDQRLYLESEIRSEYNFEDIVGKSPALRKVLEQIAIVAPTDSTALLHGETGTGKELVARAIHSLSPRKDRTFVRLNCSAIPSGLVESELFGHEKGAFTGALMQKKGRFEVADQGTLFLDEIGDISLELQPKLLRALQEHEFERLGSTKTIHVNVRLIAATHRDLRDMIAKRQFREDLFYRLNVFPVEIPPLRERREDIPLLVHHFVSQLAARMRKRIRSIPKPAMEALTAAPWPGNIRELENFIERAVILTQSDELNVPIAELKSSAVRSGAAASTFHDAERQTIIDALKAASGRIAGQDGAAERLGLKRTTLQNKMRKLNITKNDF